MRTLQRLALSYMKKKKTTKKQQNQKKNTRKDGSSYIITCQSQSPKKAIIHTAVDAIYMRHMTCTCELILIKAVKVNCGQINQS